MLNIIYHKTTIVLDNCTNCCNNINICWRAPTASKLIMNFHSIINKSWSANYLHTHTLFSIYRVSWRWIFIVLAFFTIKNRITAHNSQLDTFCIGASMIKIYSANNGCCKGNSACKNVANIFQRKNSIMHKLFIQLVFLFMIENLLWDASHSLDGILQFFFSFVCYYTQNKLKTKSALLDVIKFLPLSFSKF